MTSRRRPVEHKRRLADGSEIVVNAGVGYAEPPAGGKKQVGDSIRSLATTPALLTPRVGQEPMPSFTDRLRRRFKKNKKVITRDPTMSEGPQRRIVETKMSVNPRTGVARLRMWDSVRVSRTGLRRPAQYETTYSEKVIGPGGEVPSLATVVETDWRGINLSGGTLWLGERATGKIDFRNAILDDATIAPAGGTFIAGIDLSGASARNLRFTGDLFDCDVSMRNTDLTGADFSNVGVLTRRTGYTIARKGAHASGTPDGRIDGEFYDMRTVIDFTGSNVTSEQIRQLEGNTPAVGPFPVAYQQFTLREAQTSLGVDDDHMRILMWSGDVEVRDNFTKRRVTTEFDPDCHHVPQWEVQKLLGAGSQ
jgi:hypothetical protein